MSGFTNLSTDKKIKKGKKNFCAKYTTVLFAIRKHCSIVGLIKSTKMHLFC